MTNRTLIRPPAILSDYVRYFGVIEGCPDQGVTKNFGVLVDGTPGLIFQENAESFIFDSATRLPQLFVHGLGTSYRTKTATGGYCNLGVYFQPHGLKAVLGIDAGDLTDRYVDLDMIMVSDLTEQLLTTVKIMERIELITSFLIRQLTSRAVRNKEKAGYAVKRIMAGYPSTPRHSLCDELNLSERSLERLFKSHIGVSPRLFHRISRFQKALNGLQSGSQQSLTSLAYLYGYADQSHFIREFRQFAGGSPGQVLSRTDGALSNFPEIKQ